jgi:hypothetical protein
MFFLEYAISFSKFVAKNKRISRYFAFYGTLHAHLFPFFAKLSFSNSKESSNFASFYPIHPSLSNRNEEMDY